MIQIINKWDDKQFREIGLGLEKGIDIGVYYNSEFDWRQMRQIRLGLEEGLDVSKYARLDWNWIYMYIMRKLLKRRQ